MVTKSMPEEIKNQMIYLVTVDMIKRLIKENRVDIKILERLNKKNAETLHCTPITIT